MNDCKYGYDVHENVLAMTLIKSAVRPDETADRREHQFVYSLYPHQGSVRECNVQKEATELNIPLVVAECKEVASEKCEMGQLLSVDSDHVVLDTVKRSEDEKAYIVRLYEYKNKKSPKTKISFALPVKKVVETNLIERELDEYPVENNTWNFSLTGYEIKTFKVYVD